MSYLHLKEKTKINDDKEQWLEQERKGKVMEEKFEKEEKRKRKIGDFIGNDIWRENEVWLHYREASIGFCIFFLAWNAQSKVCVFLVDSSLFREVQALLDGDFGWNQQGFNFLLF